MSTGEYEGAPIRAITARQLVLPFGAPLETATGSFAAAYLLLVEVETEVGITGIGWTFAFSEHHLDALECMVRDLTGHLLGRDAVAVEARWQELRAVLERAGSVGVGAMALSAVDLALWDVRGKVCGLPLSALLGGDQVSVPYYHSFGLWADMTVAELEQDAAGIVGGGAKAVKMRVGGRNVKEDVRRVAAVRAVLPEGIRLMLDANSAWSVKTALWAGRALEHHDIFWLEDPTSAKDAAALREVRETMPVAVCGGEDVYLADGMDVRAAFPFDIVMLDVARVGGITGFVRLAHALDLVGLQVTPHLDTPTGIHLVAGLTNAVWVEHLPWWGQLFAEELATDAGRLVVPADPGLGVSWSPEAK